MRKSVILKWTQMVLFALVLSGPVSLVTCSLAQSEGVAAQGAYETEFETRSIVVETRQGSFEFSVEIADEPSERQKGLMFREAMPAKHGMLFDFGDPRRIQMWMRNTPLSLDMIFIRPDGVVGHIAERTTPFSDAIVDSRIPVSHVLEVNAGISKLIGLKVGDRVFFQ